MSDDVQSILYDLWPALSNSQQMVLEYSMPFSLTASFYIFETTKLGVLIGSILAVFHTLEVTSTNFDGSDPTITDDGNVHRRSRREPMIKKFLGPVEHLLIDALWMQCLFSFFFWFGPEYFGPNCIPIALAFVLSVPMNITISLKTHFVRSTSSQDKCTSLENETLRRDRCFLMGLFIRDCITCYILAAALLYYASQARSLFLTCSLFYLNTLPIIFGARYMNIYNTIPSVNNMVVPIRNQKAKSN
jgi:hypothetical protein